MAHLFYRGGRNQKAGNYFLTPLDVGSWMFFCGSVFISPPTLGLANELNIGVKPSHRSGSSTVGAGA